MTKIRVTIDLDSTSFNDMRKQLIKKLEDDSYAFEDVEVLEK